MWLLLQSKLPTADRITNHGGQTNTVCSLCCTTPETHLHMVAKCSYSKMASQQIAPCFNFQLPTQRHRTMHCWWHLLLPQGAADRINHLQVITYTVWNIWKERCHRVFQQIAITADQLASLIRQDILAYIEANTVVQ